MLVRSFHEDIERTKHRVDYLGAALLTASLSLVILGALQGGQAWAWNSPVSIAVFACGAVLFAVFLVAERRAAEPVLPPWIARRRLLATTALVSFGVGAVMLGLTSYVPTFLEGTLSTSPVFAGLALAALTLGWPISASQAGRFYLRIGFRSTALIGIAVTVIGAAVLALTASMPNIMLAAASCFVVGLGLGLVATPTLIAAQSSVQWNERGVVTGTNLFARSIGSALGVAVYGAVANAIYAGTAHGDTDPHTIASASTAVFLAVLISASLTVVAVIAMPTAARADAAGKAQARTTSA
jgi:MFS family permease